MSVAFDAISSTSGYSQSTGFTLSHTTAGSNRALVAVLQLGGSNPATQYTSVAITYNGVSMTGNASADIILTNRRTIVFALLNPASGANNLSVTWGGGGTEVRLFALSYTGVHQTTGLDSWAENSASGAGTTLTVSVTTAAENCWLVGGIFVREGGSGNITISSGTVRSQDQTSGAGDNGPLAAGARTMAWVVPANALGNGSTAALVALAPVAATSNSNFFVFM